MAYKFREDLVGKRFLAVSGATKINVNKVAEWGWKAGVIRAATHRDHASKDLQILVEYDGVDWQRREWVAIHARRAFRVFMVERTLTWCPRPSHGENIKWPALTFSPLVSELTVPADHQPTEFLLDAQLDFLDYSALQPLQDWEPELCGPGAPPELALAVQAWRSLQDGQRILTTTPSVLGGCRAQVYRVAGTTQWYTAVIVGFNETTGELTVTDDTVLEEHSEDPALVQMRLLGDGVVESIMRGEVVGVMPRRSRSNLQSRESSKSSHSRKKSTVRNNGQLAPAIEPPPPPPPLPLPPPAPPDTDKGGVCVKAVKKNRASSDSVGGVKSGGGCESNPGAVGGCKSSGADPAASPLGVGAASAGACGGADEERCAGAVASEEDDCVIVCARDAEERSDSGVSGLRSGGSGDERSGSRSSALSDEPAPPPPPHAAAPPPQSAAAPAWRAMSHGAGYAGGAPPPLLHHLPPPAPPALYAGPEMLWKPRYQQQPVAQLHHHQQHHMQHQDYLAVLDRDRERHERLLRYESLSAEHEASLGPLLMTYYDTSTKLRDYRVASTPNQPRERRDQEQRELHEKQQQQKEKERERMEREREREKAEREKQDREERERSREEKLVQNDSATKLVRKHFEESLRIANEKRERAAVSWSIIHNLAPPPARPPDHERLRQPDPRDRAYYPPTSVPVSHPQQQQRPPPPPPAHGRLAMPKQPDKQPTHPGLPKAEPNFAPYGYPSYRAPPYEKLKQETQHLPAPPPLVQEKNSVIVKHDTKPQIHLEQKHQYKGREPAHYLATRPYRTGLSPHAPHPPHPPHPPLQASPHAALPAHEPKPRARAYQPPPPRSPAYYCPAPPIRPKVSSPAPSHMYGKPTAPQDSPPVPYPPPSAYSPVPRQHLPPPPPAHSRTPEPRPQPSPTSLRPEPCQTQPLDLGMVTRDDPDRSPRRRFPFDPAADPSDAKRRRLAPDASAAEPTPLIASAAGAVSGRAPHGSDPVPQAPGPACDVRVPSADGSVETPEKAAGASPAPSVTPAASPVPQPASSPPAPAPPPPAPAATPPVSVINNDAETPAKTSSPAPAPSPKDNSAPVRHLGKKAWLQRHETAPIGEGERSGGGGVCVTLPMTVQSRVEPEEAPAPVAPPVATKSVLHRIGSMAVNSIGRTKTPKGRKPAKETNGRIDDARDGEDSSSSDRDALERAPPKRKPPKAKRRKGGGARKTPDEPKKKKASESGSGSDSDKESDGDKDSESGGSGGAGGRRGGGRPRGRRARGAGGVRGSGSGRRRDDPPAPRRQPQAGRLRRTGESFLQDGNCTEVAPRLTKCRECRWSPQQQRDKDMPNIFCRFYAFRRLRYAKNGQLAIAGFSDPYKDAEEEDKKLWLNSSGAADLDIEMSCFLLREIGDQFCELLQQEREAGTHHLNDDKTLAWKRVVQGVREMCDVCETTLFNLHWTCGKCGFVVCLDCYKSRTCGEPAAGGATGGGAAAGGEAAAGGATAAASERDAHGWLTCAGGAQAQAHAPRKLLLTQIAAGDALQAVAARCHRARALWGLPACGACPPGSEPPRAEPELARRAAGLLRAAIHQNLKREEVKEENGPTNGSSPVKTENCKNVSSTLSWLADVALSPPAVKNEHSDSSSSDSEEGNFSTLRELLIRPAPAESAETPRKKQKKNKDIVDDVISSVVHSNPDEKCEGDGKPFALKDCLKRYLRPCGRDALAVRIMTLTESRVMYPDVPHAWLCDGKLLHLTDPANQGNYKPFQDQWKRGQPVLVSDVFTQLDKSLWTPASFSRDFGDTRTDLINCASGLVVPNQPSRKFWDGFELAAKRLRDERGAPMVLKLKDWPPGEDFAELLPSRFADLMNALPLREYTARAGRLNLAARLPECFVRPDLGPKMYTAYGGAGGTTNLHLDVSDAVNVMVHASAPSDAPERAREAARAADEAGADALSRRRARQQPPGALWHIYAARDVHKIRDFLVSAEVERGGRPRPSSDPVHDQTWYLDAALRERLYREYGVEGYAVLQAPGDAVFVPAGAPHQVRNLLDCIKVAEDFVSPENVSRCFELAQQFRRLSRQHANKEDKLQIKNIVYHAVKDSLCRLEGALLM